MKVGDKVWVFDDSHRVYDKRGGGPIWIKHWRERAVIGENRVSWFIGFDRDGLTTEWDLKRARRIPKKGPLPRDVATDWKHVEQRAWVHDHQYKIGELVRRVDDYDTLKKVAEAIGYEE